MRMTDEWREMLDVQLELRRQLSGTESAEYADVLIGMAQLEDMTGNYDKSQAYSEDALAIAQQLDDRLGLAAAYTRVGRVRHLKGDYEDADYGYRNALNIYSAELGVNAIETNKARLHLATLLNHREQYEDSLALLRQALAIRQEHYPGDHSEYSEIFLATGSVLTSLDRFGEAVEIYERAFAMNERLHGPDNRFNLFIVNGLGKVAEAAGDYATAAERYGEAVRLTSMYFPDHPNLGIATSNLAKAHSLTGRFDLALPLYRDAVDIVERKLPDHWMLGGMRARLGRCIVQTDGDYAEAETLILQGIDTLMAKWGPDHATTKDAIAAAAELYSALGKPVPSFERTTAKSP